MTDDMRRLNINQTESTSNLIQCYVYIMLLLVIKCLIYDPVILTKHANLHGGGLRLHLRLGYIFCTFKKSDLWEDLNFELHIFGITEWLMFYIHLSIK